MRVGIIGNNAPYLKDILDKLVKDNIDTEIVIMKPESMGKTEIPNIPNLNFILQNGVKNAR